MIWFWFPFFLNVILTDLKVQKRKLTILHNIKDNSDSLYMLAFIAPIALSVVALALSLGLMI